MTNSSAKHSSRLVGDNALRLWALALLAVLFLWYAPTLSHLVFVYENSTSSSHGYFAPLVTAFLLWQQRNRIAAQPVSPSWKGLAFVALCAIGWTLGDIVGTAFVAQSALVGMTIGVVWAFLGDKMFRAMLGPLSFLLFTIPVAPSLVPFLMDWTAHFVVVGLRLSGIPVWQEGTSFVIPTGRWSVIELCSGVRYLSVSTFAGAVFAYVTFTSWKKRAVLVAVAVVLPLFANWLRAYTIVLVAHLSNNKYGVVVGHLTLGWIIFAVAVFAIFSVGARYRDPPRVFTAPVRGAASRPTLTRTVLSSALIAAAFAPWPMLVRHDFSIAAPPPAAATFEAFLSGCETLGDTFPIQARYETAVWRLARELRCDGGEYAVLAAWYRHQEQGRELIADANQRLFGDGWWVKPAVLSAQRMGESSMDVAQQEFQMGQIRIVMRRVYWVAGWTTTNEITAKLLLGAAKLLGRGDDSGVVMWTRHADSTDALGDATRHLERFGEDRVSLLLKAFEEARLGGR
jgi:exosortase A